MNAQNILNAETQALTPYDKKAHRSRLSNSYRTLADTLQKAATLLREQARSMDRQAFSHLERANAIDNGQMNLFDD